MVAALAVSPPVRVQFLSAGASAQVDRALALLRITEGRGGMAHEVVGLFSFAFQSSRKEYCSRSWKSTMPSSRLFSV